MDKDKEKYNKLWDESPMGRIGCGTPLLVATIVAIVLLLSSCATRQKIEYVDREVVKWQKEIVHDTLLQHTHDSVYHTIFQKGDTVYSTKYVEKTRWRDRIVEKHDTCFRDSIVTVKKETTVEVVKIPKIYRISLLFSILVIIFAIIKALRWVRTR